MIIKGGCDMISKEKLKDYANKLMFDMEENQYETLQNEFEVIQKQMDIIGQIEGLGNIEPMTFPFQLDKVELREDNRSRSIDNEDAFANCHQKKGRDVKVPRVVE